MTTRYVPFLLATLLVLTSVLPAIGAHRPANDREKMIDRSYAVNPGDALEIEVSDAHIFVETADVREARIEIWLESSTMDRARSYFEEQRFTVEQEGATVIVTDDPPRRTGLSWRSLRDTRIEIRIRIPELFDVDLRTSDGDISVGTLGGNVELASSDGDITTGNLEGPSVLVRTSDGNLRLGSLIADRVECKTSDGDITLEYAEAEVIRLRTSDGNIRATGLRGELDLVTSDGDIVVDASNGSSIRIRTSDGSIRLGRMETDRATVQTSDGDIRIEGLAGSVRATTSSGDVDVVFDAVEASYLRTSDGDVSIIVSPGTDANLDLSAEDVRIASGLQFEGRLTEEYADGQIGRGGPLLEARSSDGRVSVRSR